MERYPIIHTRNRLRAHGRLENILGPHELSIANSSQIDIRLHSYKLGSVLVSYLSFGAKSQLRLNDLQSRYLVHIPLAGSVIVSCGDDRQIIKPGAGAVCSPGESVTILCSADCGLLVVGMDSNLLQAHTRSLLHPRPTTPLRFEIPMDITLGDARDWHEMLISLVNLADNQIRLLDHPLVVADLERALMTGLVVAQPNTYTSLFDERGSGHKRGSIETAILLINTDPARNHTVASLARAAGVSVRTLEKQFQRRLGVPPYRYLRHVRLERSRAELTATTDREISVSEVAARWGFNHFGRFAQDYYSLYNEKPSETLRRRRTLCCP
ncbi:MAG TPA: AraC family transcriptional regulator [Streptosporangiaceae bacterium]|nr:AraC family transcriptional regulator [Streptosporangiaceae bacterium]